MHEYTYNTDPGPTATHSNAHFRCKIFFEPSGCRTLRPGSTLLLGPGAYSCTNQNAPFCSREWYKSNKRVDTGSKTRLREASGAATNCSLLYVCTYIADLAFHSRISSEDTLQHSATHCNTLQHSATHCNTLQHTAQHTATHTATHCNAHDVDLVLNSRVPSNDTLQCTLQHIATHRNTL